MQAAEEAAFAQGASAEALMEQAGLGMAQVLRERWPTPGHVVAYLGKGHNAGDALVAARHLASWGWHVSLRDAWPPEESSPLTRQKRAELLGRAPHDLPKDGRSLLLLDGLLGIGATGNLREPLSTLTAEMNARRQEEGAHVIAMDIPTGLDGVTGTPCSGAVEADLTLTVAYAKTGLLADHASANVGTLVLIPLPDIPPPPGHLPAHERVLTRDLLRAWHRRRPVDHFKNRAGHVHLFAGSLGYTGAAAMVAEGALTAGAGLVSLHVNPDIYPILATRCPPEIMVHPLSETLSVSDFQALKGDAFAIGPGGGSALSEVYLDWLTQESRPVVVDADALNLLARHPDRRLAVAHAGPRLFTPHPGELARLFPEEAALPTRAARARAVVDTFPITLLYKGTRSIIAQEQRPLSYNLTGNPGMATGGMGDVLTGVCAGLAAQGYALETTACLGAWLCGRAADLAIAQGETVETLRPSMLLKHLAAAFQDL